MSKKKAIKGMYNIWTAIMVAGAVMIFAAICTGDWDSIFTTSVCTAVVGIIGWWEVS